MAQISLSKRENAFLREMLLSSMRHFTREIDADVTLLSTCQDDDDMQEVYRNMLRADKSRLCNAKGIYEKLLSLVPRPSAVLVEPLHLDISEL